MSRYPALFVGHGSPMNAIERNAYTDSLRTLGERLDPPAAVLCVSAHYLTRGPRVTADEHPRTIHDFYGFPPELYEIAYPAPGDPALALRTASLVEGSTDASWGLDHASWAVLRHLWPGAEVPVVELSLDLSEPCERHYDRGRALAELRDDGVLVLGSGNVVHNLAAIDWHHRHGAYDWATAFDEAVEARLERRDDAALVDWRSLPGAELSVPSLDHYLPLLYALGAAEGEPAQTVHAGIEYGSVSMRCTLFGD